MKQPEAHNAMPPSVMAGAEATKLAEQIANGVGLHNYWKDFDGSTKYSWLDKKQRELIVTALRTTPSSLVAGSDGWQRDAALEEAAQYHDVKARLFFDGFQETGRDLYRALSSEHRDSADNIRALKSAAPTQTDDWQPIETAPKDGYVIVAVPVCWSKDGSFSHWDTWSADMSDDHDEENVYSGWRIKDATLWRPLPAAPTPSTASHSPHSDIEEMPVGGSRYLDPALDPKD